MNGGELHMVAWPYNEHWKDRLHQNIWNKVVGASCMTEINPSKGCLRRYPNGLDMGYDTDFGAGPP
eukprot:10497431-Ditylum_brightwellii.AAC.1